MTNFRKKRTLFLFIILAVLVVFACFTGFRLWKTRHSDQAAGIYITSGGQSYLVIERGFLGSLNVKEGYFITSVIDLFNPRNLSGMTLAAKFSDDRLFLAQQESYLIKGISGRITERDRFLLSLELYPSQSIPGDWDLQNVELNVNLDNSALLFSSEYWKEIKISGSWRQFRESLLKPFRAHEIVRYIYDPTGKPMYSLIHRVDDPRVVEYFHLRLNGVLNQDTLDLARKLAAFHLGDPYLELHRIEMEALVGNPEEAEKLWKDWQKTHKAFPDFLLQRMARRVFRTVYMEKIKKKSPDVMDPDKVLKAGQYDLLTRLNWLKNFLASDQLFFLSYPLVPPLKSSSYSPPAIPNFLGFQVDAKVARTMATLYLFQGRREESLEIFAASYRLAQSMNAHGTIIQRLIGMAIRAISCAGLQIYALNACETEEDFQKLWAMLERLHNTPAQEDGTNIFEDEMSPFVSLLKPVSGTAVPNYLEAQTRHKITDMKFQLLRMSTAAKYRFITTGDFPSSEKEFAPFLPDGPPPDVFAKNAPLRFTRSSPNEFTVYSIGPDDIDDMASISYDPTNGTITPGDIFITIPSKREFPFPKQGVHAATAYDLLQQFPNGLPADVFADTKGLPLSIIESTNTQPVVIFSFGPDTDENERHFLGFPSPFAPGEGTYLSRVRKAPVNTPTPTPTPTPSPPVLTPDPGPHPSYGRTLQKVFRRSRSEAIPSPAGSRTLQPMYDPTNGTVSPGDLFIEIPR